MQHFLKENQTPTRGSKNNELNLIHQIFQRRYYQSKSRYIQLTHFEDIFAAIDTDGTEYISKKELKQLIRKFNLDYTERDVNLMMEVVSSDGDKVSKRELANFLCQNWYRYKIIQIKISCNECIHYPQIFHS